MTPAIARRLQTLPSPGLRSDVFAKVGDSQTVNAGFLHCLKGGSVDLAGQADLEPTRRFFLGPDDGATTFDRESLSAKVGASASFALGGPLLQEVAASHPRYAVVMYGSNDIQNAPTRGASEYADNMIRIADALLEKGVIPILSSPPPRPLRDADVQAFGPAGADVWVPRFGNVVRGIAQSRRIPFIDLERELRRLPQMGIGSDHLHLSLAPGGACHFDDASLGFGMNTRNLVTLAALDRARAAVERAAAPDDDGDESLLMDGAGTADNPFTVRELPFADGRAMTESTASHEAACAGVTPRFTYAIRLDHAATVHFGLYGAAGKHAELVVKTEGGDCRPVAKRDAALPLEAGAYRVIVGSAGDAPSGEYLLTVTPNVGTH